MIATAFGKKPESDLFWERELQNSATPAPTVSSIVFSTDSPTRSPRTAPPTKIRTPAPTFRCNLPLIQRRTQILSILSGVSDQTLLSTVGSFQNSAAEWLIADDDFYVCPGDEKLIQRYVMALFYFSTGGDSWNLCSQNDSGCVGENTPFLAPVHECEWFGLSCDTDLCMNTINFEANNVAGSIPSELEQLTGLEVLSLEQGGIVSTIPPNLGSLTKLRILDLDFNSVFGTIPEQIYSLAALEQLDLNSNRLTGTISDSVGNLGSLQLLQLYENLMTGTIPATLGNVQSLVIGEFYNNTFTGVMPQSVCDNRSPNGALTGLTSDCFPNPTPQIECSCCTGCAVF